MSENRIKETLLPFLSALANGSLIIKAFALDKELVIELSCLETEDKKYLLLSKFVITPLHPCLLS